MMQLIFPRSSGIIVIEICLLCCLLVAGVSAVNTYTVGNHALQNITTLSNHSVQSVEIGHPDLPSTPPEQPTLPVIPTSSVPVCKSDSGYCDAAPVDRYCSAGLHRYDPVSVSPPVMILPNIFVFSGRPFYHACGEFCV